MLKLLYSITLFGSLLSAFGVALPAIAQYVPGQDNLGICETPPFDGRSVVDTSVGRVVSLEEFCREQLPARTLLIPVEEVAAVPVVTVGSDRFWQAFVAAASPSALEFSRTVSPQFVSDYGLGICSFLRSGSTLQEVRQIQRDGDLPPSFEVAVTVAALNTYCPDYRNQLGRS